MEQPDQRAAARAAADPDGPPMIAAYVCDACNLVHLGVVRAGATLTAVGMSADQGAAAVFELQAAAGAAYAGHPFLSAPRVSDGSVVLSCTAAAGGTVILALGHTARAAFRVALSPDAAKALAEKVDAAVAVARDRESRERATVDAYHAGHGHPDMVSTVDAMVGRFAATGCGDEGLLSVGCVCGAVHLFPVRSGKAGDYLTMQPEDAEGFAADLVRSCGEARALAKAAAADASDAVTADAPATKH